MLDAAHAELFHGTDSDDTARYCNGQVIGLDRHVPMAMPVLKLLCVQLGNPNSLRARAAGKPTAARASLLGKAMTASEKTLLEHVFRLAIRDRENSYQPFDTPADKKQTASEIQRMKQLRDKLLGEKR